MKDENTNKSAQSVELLFTGHRRYGSSSIQHQREKDKQYPENSLISIREVMRSGADAIEFDLHLSSDKGLMVIHDDDLSINAMYKLQERDSGKHPAPIGTLVNINKGSTHVNQHNIKTLKQEYDISKGQGTDKLESHLYTKIPEFKEVLELVVEENKRRITEDKGLQPIKLNVELKGIGTGTYVQKAINDFNAGQEISNKIKQDDIYYMSFFDRELAAVAGLDMGPTQTKTLAIEPKAHLILGVPSAVQYKGVDLADHFAITDATLNKNELDTKVGKLHNALKQLSGRNNQGLTGVDMSLWDVNEQTTKYFCKDLQTPIHLAIVPLEHEEISNPKIGSALRNIEKIHNKQNKYFTEPISIMLKTDNPKLLENHLEKISQHKQFINVKNVEFSDITLMPNLPIMNSIPSKELSIMATIKKHAKIELHSKPGQQRPQVGSVIREETSKSDIISKSDQPKMKKQATLPVKKRLEGHNR